MGKSNSIWMITSSFYPHIGGGEQQALQLSQALTKRGWITQVLTRRHNHLYEYLPPACEKLAGVPVRRLDCPGPNRVGSLKFIRAGLAYLARNGRNSIYHAHGIGAPAIIATLAARWFNGKSLIKLRSGVNYYQNLRRSRLKRLFLMSQLGAADRLIIVNKALEGELTRWSVPHHRITHIPNSVDTKFFRPATEIEKQHCRERILQNSQGQEKTLFLYVGRLAYLKGVDLLLTAWANLPRERRDKSRLLIVGDGPEKDRLTQQAASLNLLSSVSFFGKRTDVLDFYWASDVAVLPSRTEGLSNTMIEAMACGLPVLCTQVGGAIDWIRSKQNGLLTSPENAQSLCSAILWILENEGCWSRIGLSARATVEDSLDLNKILGYFEREYQVLAAEISN